MSPGPGVIPPDLVFWLSLALKLALTAGIVVSASVVVERAGPLIGALVVTLPVTVWPAYVFLSLDHDAAYVAASAQSGLAVNAVSAVFMLGYVVLAQRRGLLASLVAAAACWVGLAFLVRSVAWSAGAAGLLNLVAYAACIALSRRFRDAPVPRMRRQWYELPLRTALVCVLMGAVLGLSHWAGPSAVGMVAVYPISTTCTMLIVHTRIGGHASAAVIANGLWGMLGIGLGLLALSQTILPLGAPAALALALALPVGWNLSVWYARRYRAIA
ncbi:MAG: hypothetical protein A2V78_05785 [Betaproteobacteria bacterium RBG_16_64_18]|nr:MAG: hypothetical protein A2V78_05785 [Betaproteobacteria bacterium RBG_16_64_18]OGA08878.1 MAG: hypothetical protein A3H33_01900 [Betaproteobacteria bacterium RIFCSPLOWO2_02_FULL_65_20]